MTEVRFIPPSASCRDWRIAAWRDYKTVRFGRGTTIAEAVSDFRRR